MSRVLIFRATALVLTAVLAAPTVRAAPREKPRWMHEVHGFIAGDRLLRLEISSTYSSRGLETIGAVLYGTPLQSTPATAHPFTSSAHAIQEVALNALLPLPEPVPPPAEETWIMELQWDVTFDEKMATSTYRVGPDRVTVRFPRELIGTDRVAKASATTPSIELDVNGVTTFVDPGMLAEWQPATRRLDSEIVVTDLPTPLHDPQGFTEKWAGFRNLMDIVYKQRMARIDEPGKARCMGPCLACAGGLLATFGTSLALVATCGGALVTGGATAIGCLIVFIAHESAMLTTAAGCSVCGTCAATGGRTGGVRPEECCPCLGSPNCQCPPSCTSLGG